MFTICLPTLQPQHQQEDPTRRNTKEFVKLAPSQACSIQSSPTPHTMEPCNSPALQARKDTRTSSCTDAPVEAPPLRTKGGSRRRATLSCSIKTTLGIQTHGQQGQHKVPFQTSTDRRGLFPVPEQGMLLHPMPRPQAPYVPRTHVETSCAQERVLLSASQACAAPHEYRMRAPAVSGGCT